jgi:hypothetical protein
MSSFHHVPHVQSVQKGWGFMLILPPKKPKQFSLSLTKLFFQEMCSYKHASTWQSNKMERHQHFGVADI